MRCSNILKQLTVKLAEITACPELEARVLLEYATGYSRLKMIAHPELDCEGSALIKLESALARRLTSEPLAYITNSREFWGLEFYVDERVLIPRPESELLVELSIGYLQNLKKVRLLDLGTGSGCLAISLAHQLKVHGISAQILAIDASSAALEVAAINCKKHDLVSNIELRQGKWFEALRPGEQFDLVVSNPPYVDRESTLEKDLCYEPSSALYADDQGLSDVTQLLCGVDCYFSSSQAKFLCEIGFGQADIISQRFANLNLHYHKDLAGIERVLVLPSDELKE